MSAELDHASETDDRGGLSPTTVLVTVATLVLTGVLGVFLGRALADDDGDEGGTSSEQLDEVAFVVTGPVGDERTADGALVPVLQPTVQSDEVEDGEVLLDSDFPVIAPAAAELAAAPIAPGVFDAPGAGAIIDATSAADQSERADADTESADPATGDRVDSSPDSSDPDSSDPDSSDSAAGVPTGDERPVDGDVSGDDDSESEPSGGDSSTSGDGGSSASGSPGSISVEQVDGVLTELPAPPGPAAPGGFFFDPDLPILDLIPPLFIDPCAGAEPDAPPPPGCPPGVGATLFGLEVPGPFVNIVRGVAPVDPAGPTVEPCPTSAPSRVVHTVLSRTPLADFEVRFREFGSETWRAATFTPRGELASGAPDEWTSMNDAWMSMFDAGEIEPGWDVLPYCIALNHRNVVPHEVELTGTDTFGRPVASGIVLLVPANSQLRPPTEFRVDVVRSAVEIDRWLRPWEQSHLSSIEISSTTDPESVPCSRATRYSPARAVRWPAGELPGPAGLFDDEISSIDRSRTNLTPGSRTLICGAGFGRLLVELPTARYPTIVLQGVRDIADESNLPAVTVTLGDPAGCGVAAGVRELEDGTSVNLDLGSGLSTRWDCSGGGYPVQLDGRGTVPVSVRDADDRIVGTAAVPIDVQSCVGLWIQPDGSSTDCPPPRTRQWFEVPVWLDGACTWAPGCGEPDAIVVLRTEDRDVRGTGVGSARTVDLGEIALPDTIQLSDFDYRSTRRGTGRVDLTFRFTSDRPISGEMRPVLRAPFDPECALPESVEFDTASGRNRYMLRVDGVCRGTSFTLDFAVAAEEGGETQLLYPPTAFSAPPLTMEVDTTAVLDPAATSSDWAYFQNEYISHGTGRSERIRNLLGPESECSPLRGRLAFTLNPLLLEWDGRSDVVLTYRIRMTRRGEPGCIDGTPREALEFTTSLSPDQMTSTTPTEVLVEGELVPVLLEFEVSTSRNRIGR